VAERAQGAASYSARLKVSLRGKDLRARTIALVAFRRPDALRVEVPGPAGARILAVARAERLVAVFPGDRAVFEGRATAADLGALLGVALEPAEVMDLLVGTAPRQARGYQARWGPEAPRRIKAELPDGTRIDLTIEEPRLGADLPERAFLDPPHAGYRPVGAEEARGSGGGHEGARSLRARLRHWNLGLEVLGLREDGYHELRTSSRRSTSTTSGHAAAPGVNAGHPDVPRRRNLAGGRLELQGLREGARVSRSRS
jgi:hypothetical protein